MKIKDILGQGKPTLSFEVFPPKTEDKYESVEKLSLIHISCQRQHSRYAEAALRDRVFFYRKLYRGHIHGRSDGPHAERKRPVSGVENQFYLHEPGGKAGRICRDRVEWQ